VENLPACVGAAAYALADELKKSPLEITWRIKASK
jgi:hypothetical protein